MTAGDNLVANKDQYCFKTIDDDIVLFIGN